MRLIPIAMKLILQVLCIMASMGRGEEKCEAHEALEAQCGECAQLSEQLHL